MDKTWSNSTQWVNISTTDAEFEITASTPPLIGFLGICGVVCFILLYLVWECIKCIKRKQKKTEISWDALPDYNSVRSNFKSTESVKSYISAQQPTTYMVISISILAISIFLNTYTNIKGFLHHFQDSEDFNGNGNLYDFVAPIVFGSLSVATLSMVEFVITISFIYICLLKLIFRFNYIDCIQCMVLWLPNVSSMVYFTFLNTKQQKKFICEAIDKAHGLGRKICCIFGIIIMSLMLGLVGLWVFVTKIKQISYIYDQNLSELGWYDFLQVLGVARQFAVLYSLHKEQDCFSYIFTTIHPSQMKKEEYSINTVVCEEMIKQRGIFGYFWCCYMFSDLDNVKKLYLEINDEENLISQDDDAQTQYVTMNALSIN